MLAIAAGVSGRLAFNASDSTRLAAPTYIYVVCAAVLAGALGAVLVGVAWDAALYRAKAEGRNRSVLAALPEA